MTSFSLRYEERAAYCDCLLAKQLFLLLARKKTNLAFSADVETCDELIAQIELLGSYIAVLKTHIDIIKDFKFSVIDKLKQLAKQHEFFIFEDRKFADIGNTVKQQYAGGIYRMVEWADITNAHALPGENVIQGLREAAKSYTRGLLLLAEMSSAGHLLDDAYQRKTLQMAEQYPDFVMGFISQHALSPHPKWIYLTPGVKLQTGQDTLGQQYVTPETAILKNGSDIIIVGRGIITAKDPLAEAMRYRDAGWQAYLLRSQQRALVS